MVAWYGAMLPAALVEEAMSIRAELDFLGVNYYTRRIVGAGSDGLLAVRASIPASAARTAMGWEVYPGGLRQVLTRVHRDYGVDSLIVTENGASYTDIPDGTTHIEDPERRAYLAAHLSATADAIAVGAPIDGYFVWALLDNFEWAQGYSQRFGLIYVDYPSRRRVVKASGLWYRDLIAATAKAPSR